VPTPLLDEVKKLTSDPGARRLAQYLDGLTARIDVCCPPTPVPVPLKPDTKPEEK
jgi:hypothetical protein